jgi:purine-binding chemotaxis protein CheW
MHVLGVLNLRGTIVPLIDLRSKFGLDSIERNQFNAIIVVVVRDRTVGVVVDSVSAVITVARASIQPVPEFASGPSNVISGMVKTEESLTILLDIEAVLNDDLSVCALAA